MGWRTNGPRIWLMSRRSRTSACARGAAHSRSALDVGLGCAAVYLIDRAGDVRRLPRCEECDKAAKLGRVTQAAHRDGGCQRRQLPLKLLVALRATTCLRADPGRQERARQDQVDRDAV